MRRLRAGRTYPGRLPGRAPVPHQGRRALCARTRGGHVPRPCLACVPGAGDPLPRLAAGDAGLRAAHHRRAYRPCHAGRRGARPGPSHVGRVRTLDGPAGGDGRRAGRQPARRLRRRPVEGARRRRRARPVRHHARPAQPAGRDRRPRLEECARPGRGERARGRRGRPLPDAARERVRGRVRLRLRPRAAHQHPAPLRPRRVRDAAAQGPRGAQAWRSRGDGRDGSGREPRHPTRCGGLRARRSGR